MNDVRQSAVQPLSDTRAWLVLAVTSVTVILVFLNSSGLVVALPSMTRDLAATPVQATWFLLSYMLVTTALILVFGRLADLFGRRPLYLAGVAVFLVATLVAGLAPSAELFIVARFIQGVGAASVITNNTAILADSFPSHLLSSGLGLNATVAALGQVLGPVVGGFVVELLGWRWMFLLCVPLLLIGLVAACVLIPRTSVRCRGERMDAVGALVVIAGLAALVLSIDTLSTTGDPASPAVWGGGAGAVVLLSAFILVQRRRTHPLVNLEIFDRSTVLLYTSGFLAAFSNFAVILVASLYLQSAMGRSALEAGVLVVPAPLGTTLAAVCAGWLAKRIHHSTLTALGTGLIAVGAMTVALAVGLEHSYWGIALGLLLAGLGTGLFMTPNTSALMLTVPAARRGISNAVRSTLQNAGYLLSTSIGLGVAGLFLPGRDRTDAYAGVLSSRGGDVEAFTSGVVVALSIMSVAAVLALWACLATRKDKGARGREATGMEPTAAPDGSVEINPDRVRVPGDGTA